MDQVTLKRHLNDICSDIDKGIRLNAKARKSLVGSAIPSIVTPRIGGVEAHIETVVVLTATPVPEYLAPSV